MTGTVNENVMITLFGVDINKYRKYVICQGIYLWPLLPDVMCWYIYYMMSLNTLLRNNIHETSAYIEFNVHSTCGL